jgi:hypothetical protein
MWSTPSGFGPLTIIFFVLICVAVMFVIMRMMQQHGHMSGWAGMMSCYGSHAAMHNGAEQDGPNRAIWPHSTSSSAFDEYRAETLCLLEQEQGEFQEFLDRLRKAKDQAEFDQFINQRRAKVVQA